ncbi:unnamed protein product [Periconia digitata]|uniref:Tat pathway signal sequence n=1 Tax=Periconia digitata TaxID=1303443 RepID=A0A9W4UGM3_9PLEO|nr:unnamed protein product [Periconia digitata]
MFGRWKREPDYKRVNAQDEINDAPERTQRRRSEYRGTPSHFLSYPVSFLSGVSVTIAALALWAAFHSSSSFETGFHTEIGKLHPIVKLAPTKFTGTLKYKGEHLYIDLGPNGTQYFGKPSPEIDAAWDTLVEGIGNEDVWPGDIISPDVLHTLHCLNAVRKLLDSPYYYKKPMEAHNRARRIHIDHCLNHIRQIIQCHMDITPVHTLYFEEMNTDVGNFDQVHMCRDFSQLHNFMVEKGKDKQLSDEKELKPGEMGPDGKKVHREGYPENEESFLPWNTTWKEFD